MKHTQRANGAQGPGRISYKDAGAAARAAWDKAMTAEIRTVKGTRPLNCTELRVLGVVLNYTTSYSKLIDRRGVEQIAEVAGRAATTTARALNVLDDAGIIRYTPGGQFRGHVSTIEIPLERGTTNSPPYEVERGTTNGPPKDGLGGRVGSDKGDELGPFRGTTNSPPREKKNFTRGERELLLPRDEDEQHTVAKVSAEEIPSPFADDHALSGGPDREGLTSPFTADSGEGRSDSRAAESPGAERVRAHLQSLGYSSAVVLEVIRRLHDGVENPEAWGSSITPEIERGRSRFGRSRQAGGSGPMPCWMDIRDNQRKVAEERERGYKPPDWRKEVVPA